MDLPKRADNDLRFVVPLGGFHLAWASIDLLVDCAIAKFLGCTPEQMLLITSGMMYGPKNRLLYGLVDLSGHPRKSDIKGALNALLNESLRNALTHSYVIANEQEIKFIERRRGQAANEHTFTIQQFQDHVRAFAKTASDLGIALGYSMDELNEVVSAVRKQV